MTLTSSPNFSSMPVISYVPDAGQPIARTAVVGATIIIFWTLIQLYCLNTLILQQSEPIATRLCFRKTCQLIKITWLARLAGLLKRLADENIWCIGFANPRGIQPKFNEEITLLFFKSSPRPQINKIIIISDMFISPIVIHYRKLSMCTSSRHTSPPPSRNRTGFYQS